MAGPAPASQRLDASRPVGGDPAEHGRTIQPQIGGNILCRRPRLNLLHRTNTDRLKRRVIKLPAIGVPPAKSIPPTQPKI